MQTTRNWRCRRKMHAASPPMPAPITTTSYCGAAPAANGAASAGVGAPVLAACGDGLPGSTCLIGSLLRQGYRLQGTGELRPEARVRLKGEAPPNLPERKSQEE